MVRVPARSFSQIVPRYPHDSHASQQRKKVPSGSDSLDQLAESPTAYRATFHATEGAEALGTNRQQDGIGSTRLFQTESHIMPRPLCRHPSELLEKILRSPRPTLIISTTAESTRPASPSAPGIAHPNLPPYPHGEILYIRTECTTTRQLPTATCLPFQTCLTAARHRAVSSILPKRQHIACRCCRLGILPEAPQAHRLFRRLNHDPLR